MVEKLVQKILRAVAAKRLSVNEAADQLLCEFGRGSRILVVDENLLDLESELSEMGYTTKTVDLGLSDERIKRTLKSRVLITHNGDDFKDGKKFYYGLIWVVSKSPAPLLAKKIRKVLMTSNFGRHLVQVVKV